MNSNYKIFNSSSIVLPKILSFIFLLVLCCLVGIASTSAQTFKLKGSLINGASKEYIQGAGVTLRETAFASQSDLAGNFELEDVFAGKFVLIIRAQGFQAFSTILDINQDIDLGSISLFPLGYVDEEDAAILRSIRSLNLANQLSSRPNYFMGGAPIVGIAPDPKLLEGNFYLDEKWNQASVVLYKDEEFIEGFLVRYNINSNTLEMKMPDSNDVTAIPGFRVKYMVWMDAKYLVPRYFINGMDLMENEAPISGFFEVLVDGMIPLVRRTIANIRPSDYNHALMVGERNDRIIKRYTYYFIDDKNVMEIPKKKKQFYQIFGEKAEEVQEFVSQNNLKLKNPSAIFSIFTYYNSQYEGFDPIMKQFQEI